jgi:hypothetical protein
VSNTGTRHEHVGTSGETTLSGAITASSTTITVADGTGFPQGTVGTFYLTIGRGTANEEIVLCSSRASNTFTVAPSGRGASGSVARSHNTSETVEHAWVSDEADALDFHAAATATVHGVATQVVGTADTQTITNKTINGTQNTLEAIPQSAVVSLTTDLGTLTTGVAGKAATVHTHAEADVTSLVADLASKQATSQKGAASGYASLDGTTKVPIAQIPTGSTGTTVPLGNHGHSGAYTVTLLDQWEINAALQNLTAGSPGPKTLVTWSNTVASGGLYMVVGTVRGGSLDAGGTARCEYTLTTSGSATVNYNGAMGVIVEMGSTGGCGGAQVMGVIAVATGGTLNILLRAERLGGTSNFTIGSNQSMIQTYKLNNLAV